jgi:hypothetical protein
MNESLGIGSAEVSVGPSDQDSAQTEEVGAKNEIFAAVRITNNSSNEDVRVRSIRFQQTGSAGASDIDNLRVIVDGVEYPTVADGDFHTATLGSGIVVAEGFNKEVELRGDIVGGSGRTVNFDIDSSTDLYITGETYGFGVGATQTENGTVGTGSEMTSGTPFFSGSTFTVSAGSLTSWSKSNNVPAQNVAINVPNQPLGAFESDIKGEAISVQSMTFNFLIAGGPVGTDVDNVTLVDENGAVVAGPTDMTGAGAAGTVVFSDTVTIPVGKHTYTLKGKLDPSFGNDDTIVASSSPSADWSGVEGEDTGDTISSAALPGVATGNTMTVKAAAVSAKVSTSPSAQNIVGGVSGMTVSNIQLDASQSGEDVRFTSMQLRYTNSGGDATNCRLFDGDTQLTDSAVNPTTTGTPYTFSLNQSVVVAKGTIKTLGVKCDVTGSVAPASTFSFGVDAADTISGTGVDSGSSVDASDNTNVGPTMTVVGAGTLAVTLDSSSPSYALAAAGTADVTLAVLKFTSTNEDIRLDRVALQLSNSSASSSPSDLLTVGIYNGSTKVGSAVFSGSSRNATSTLTSTVIVPKDDDLVLTVKGTMSEIGASQPGTQGALVQVDFNDDDSTGTRGIGMDSGATIDAPASSAGDTASAGVRLFRSFPTYGNAALSNTELINGTNKIHRFSLTADAARAIGLYKVTLSMATTGVTTSGVNVYAFTDSGFSIPVSGVRSDGALNTADNAGVLSPMEFVVQPNPLQIPAGTTRYFEVRATVSGAGDNGDSIQTSLLGDTAYPALATLMANAAAIDADTNDDFIWSPNATTTSSATHADWTNGFQIQGLSSETASVLSN